MRDYKTREMDRILKDHGYTYTRSSGSHNIYHDAEGRMAVVPVRLKAVIACRLIREISQR